VLAFLVMALTAWSPGQLLPPVGVVVAVNVRSVISAEWNEDGRPWVRDGVPLGDFDTPYLQVQANVPVVITESKPVDGVVTCTIAAAP
jgi:hypothetical protein